MSVHTCFIINAITNDLKDECIQVTPASSFAVLSWFLPLIYNTMKR